MKRRRKQVGNPSSIAMKDVQPVGLVAGGSRIGCGHVQELVGVYIVVVLLFVAFSFWFSFGMFQ